MIMGNCPNCKTKVYSQIDVAIDGETFKCDKCGTELQVDITISVVLPKGEGFKPDPKDIC
jgi:transcription elongation factor Elf1